MFVPGFLSWYFAGPKCHVVAHSQGRTLWRFPRQGVGHLFWMLHAVSCSHSPRMVWPYRCQAITQTAGGHTFLPQCKLAVITSNPYMSLPGQCDIFISHLLVRNKDKFPRATYFYYFYCHPSDGFLWTWDLIAICYPGTFRCRRPQFQKAAVKIARDFGHSKPLGSPWKNLETSPVVVLRKSLKLSLFSFKIFEDASFVKLERLWFWEHLEHGRHSPWILSTSPIPFLPWPHTSSG